MNLVKTLFVSAALMSFGIGAASASSTIVVPGTANPFLAGAASGDSVNNGDVDTYDADHPVGISVAGGQTVSITNVSGTVSNGPCCAFDGPDGGANIGASSFTSSGFTALVNLYPSLPINSLIGVFYGPTAEPGLYNVFEIGGSAQNIVVPTGATELYLGTVDGYQWNNNLGAFSVTYSVGGVPEPAAWIIMIAGFGMLGAVLRRSGTLATA